MKTEPFKMTLFLMRISVFIVFLVWTLDKFLNPEHTSKVFQHFYFSPAFGSTTSTLIGAVQLICITGFLLGLYKKWTYGAVFAMHFISTVSSYMMYLKPWAFPNILFFAAIPMLAACYMLYVFREEDTLFTVQRA